MAARGRYSLVRKIADGGTAEVFLANMEGSAGFKRLVVLKRVLPKLWADEQFRRGLIDEAHIAMGLHHSNIVQVLDLGVAGQNYFLAFELVDGWTLSQIVKRMNAAHEPMPLNLVLHVLAEVCRGLGYAHTRSENGVPLAIVHRDVTPQNVLLSEQGEVKLTDFGIARARTRASTSQIGTVKGKPAYMSPEQTQGLALDARSDLFAVGVMLYQLVTGALPFTAPTVPEQMVRVVKGEYEPPDVKRPGLPAPVSQLIAKALQREPSHRFQSADELLHAIERVQRTALEPAGQTELKRWLAALAEKDHALPLSRGAENQPAIPLPQDGSSAIELQDDDIVLTTGVSAAPRTSSRWWRAAALVGIGGAAAFLLLRPTIEPGPIVALVDAGTLEAATEAPFADAGTLEAATEAPLADAGTLEAATEAPLADAGTLEAATETPLADTRDAGGEVVASSVPTRAPPSRPKPLPAPTPVVADNVSVLIESEPPGALVRIDKNTFGATPLPLRLRIGVAFELVLTKPGHRETRVTYFVTRRANQKVRAVLPKSK